MIAVAGFTEIDLRTRLGALGAINPVLREAMVKMVEAGFSRATSAEMMRAIWITEQIADRGISPAEFLSQEQLAHLWSVWKHIDGPPAPPP